MTPNGPLTIIPSLRQAPYDAKSDLVPVARIGDLVCGFVIHPSVGPKTFAEMVDYAKKNPGKLNYGSAGLATGTHMRLEMLKYKTGIDIIARAVSRQCRRAERPVARQHPDDERDQRAAACEGRQADPAQRQLWKAVAGFPRHADADRARRDRTPTNRSGTAPSRRRARRRGSSTSSMPRYGRSARPTT